MAEHASTTPTRRTLFAAAPALALAPTAATGLACRPNVAAATTTRRQAFIDEIAAVHSRGRLVATRAMAMGLNPDDCMNYQTYCRENPARMPTLTFRNRMPGKAFCDWIVVGPDFAFEQGAV